MRFIADLHIHSKYSRATSKQLTIENLEKYANIKGIDMLGTGDFTHPKWIAELKTELSEDDTGILRTKSGFPFMLQTEISLIYSQGGKGRRVHNIVLAPDFDTVSQITDYLLTKGRIDYDGRPIFKIPCPEFVESLRSINKKIEVIPAHCLLPDSLVHCDESVKKISHIKKGDIVLTHLGRLKKVTKIYKRKYQGRVLKIIPACLKNSCHITPEHPVYAIKSYKICKNMPHTICKPTCAYLKRGCKLKKFEDYKAGWILAGNLEKGDIILYPRYKKTKDKISLYLNRIFPDFFLKRGYIKPKNIATGTKNIPIKNKIEISKEFCRLIGYYLAEGYVLKDRISFTFNKQEKEYIKDVRDLLLNIFGDKINFYEEKEKSKGKTFSVYSKVLSRFFKQFYSSNTYNASNKLIPCWMMDLPIEKQMQLFLGWWRGDKGYTVSVNLANQMKIILLRLGVIPAISKISYKDVILRRLKKPCIINGRKISAKKDCYYFNNLSFFGEDHNLLKYQEFKRYKTTLKRRKGWLDDNFIYLPIIKIDKRDYEGDVFNLEISDDNSYLTEALAVHNCWTPWFSMLGSKSGFDSVEECFGDQTKHIHALETGLSSDPPMNWRLSQLDRFTLVSNSDLHSFWPWRIGREANIFDTSMTYNNIIKALHTRKGFKGTIEVDPAYGKYHYDGHRKCSFCSSPKETMKLKGICPVCKKPLTIGVDYRVEELADRPEGFVLKGAPDFYSLIPLSDIISVIVGKAVATKTVWAEYYKLVKDGRSEFDVLMNIPLEELKKDVDEKIAKAIIKARQGSVKVKPGYDGEYGVPVFGNKVIENNSLPESKTPQKGLSD